MKNLKVLAVTSLTGMAVLLAGCGAEINQDSPAPAVLAAKTHFELLGPATTGVGFANEIRETSQMSILTNDYMYTGAGVALGDIDNDGLLDIFFGGNMTPCRLYRNLGSFRFADITEKAGIRTHPNSWVSGVSFADVNQDGWMDIYLCRSTRKEPELRANLLFINQGDTTFLESASEYGIADESHSLQAAFFDYDLDNDLDLYVANHPGKFFMEFEENVAIHNNPLPLETSDHLYKNDGGKFTDVTKAAGILNFGFGLGLAIGDLNEDGYPDVYVANDYLEPDFYYINNGNGTFTESLKKHFRHTSLFGMGSSIADINNDALPDILVADMVAEDNFRQKTMMPSMNIEGFWMTVNAGFHYQYMRNTLQLNNGMGSFSEIGQFAGIPKTDWSWAVLTADFDNDSWKDIYVTNGIRRDSRNVDASRKQQDMVDKASGRLYTEKTEEMLALYPVTKLNHYYFRNTGALHFENLTLESGMSQKSFSHGAAWGDLDNDGDLEIVVNNLLDPAFIYRNNTRETGGGHYLRVRFEGEKGNHLGIGAKVTVRTGEMIQFQEMQPVKGYLSSVEHTLHFGVGSNRTITEMKVEWPGGRTQVIANLDADQELILKVHEAALPRMTAPKPQPLFTELSPPGYLHVESDFNDFETEVLIPHRMSRQGPAVASADVNGDGLDDFFAGSGAGQPGVMMIQQPGGGFAEKRNQGWKAHAEREIVGASFLDIDGDGDPDLYLVSGSNEFGEDEAMLADGLYINDGQGNFKDGSSGIPETGLCGSCAASADYDGDGDDDLFVGGSSIPGKYPHYAPSQLLRNDHGTLVEVTEQPAPGISGIVTSAVFSDFDRDNDADLFLAGEWMPVTLLENRDGSFTRKEVSEFSHTAGWWFRITAADMDADGDEDYIAGNFGQNSKFKVSEKEPLHVYCNDFDKSGTLDIVLGYYNQGVCFPVRGRQCSSEQMPFIREKFPTYNDYGKATITDVYGQALEEALHYEAHTFASVYIENLGNGRFRVSELPAQVQFSTVTGIVVSDFTSDGKMDLLISGNYYPMEIETGRNDAGTGLLLEGNGKGGFTNVPLARSGFYAPDDARGMVALKGRGMTTIAVVNNMGPVQLFGLTGRQSSLTTAR